MKTQHSSTTKPTRTSNGSSRAGPAVAQSKSPMPTGNGFGYAVVDATSGALIKFFAHPYCFMCPPVDVEDAVPETTSFIEEAAWGPPSLVRSVSYAEQSHIIEVIDDKSTAHFFMPFTLARNVLLAVNAAADRCLAVTWEHSVHSHRTVDVGNLPVEVVKFDDVPERIVVVPLADGW